jgi:hypothetical protein
MATSGTHPKNTPMEFQSLEIKGVISELLHLVLTDQINGHIWAPFAPKTQLLHTAPSAILKTQRISKVSTSLLS